MIGFFCEGISPFSISSASPADCVTSAIAEMSMAAAGGGWCASEAGGRAARISGGGTPPARRAKGSGAHRGLDQTNNSLLEEVCARARR